MITTAVIQVIAFPVLFVLGLLPEVTEIPLIDAFLATGFGYVRQVAEFFPPFLTAIQIFTLYVSFKILMVVVRFIIGNRAPQF